MNEDIFELSQNEKFPVFKWNGEWKGQITLESWKGFQSRNGSYGSIDSKSPSQGHSKIRIDNNADTNNREITNGQIAAIEFLINNEITVKNKILEKLLLYYQQLRIDWGAEGEEWMPTVKSIESFKDMIGLSWIHISQVEKDEIAYLGFEIGCTWDEEHGLGVMLHKDRIIDIGGADSSFLWWIAERDRKGEPIHGK
jgi:hypothetical protein